MIGESVYILVFFFQTSKTLVLEFQQLEHKM